MPHGHVKLSSAAALLANREHVRKVRCAQQLHAMIAAVAHAQQRIVG